MTVKDIKMRFKNGASMLMHFLRGCKRYFAASVLCAFLMALFEMINPKLIAYTADHLAEVADSLGLIALLVVAVALLRALFRYLFGAANAAASERLVKNMRDDLYTHILHLPYKWHGENQTGDIIQRCTSDVDQIKRFLSNQMVSLFRTGILIVLALYFMATIDLRVTAVSGAFIPVVLWYSVTYRKKMSDRFLESDEQEGHLSTVVQENLTGVRVVRAFGREAYERNRFERDNEHYTGLTVHVIDLMSQFWAVSDMLSGAQILSVVAYGAALCVGESLSVGNYMALIYYNAMLTGPVRALGRVLSEMSKAMIALERVRYIMNSEEERDEGSAQPWPQSSDIEFSHVTFSYDGKNKVLDDVSMTISEGQTVGILGGTGSGKSTLMLLLTKLYELGEADGNIYIGKTDIRSLKAADVRRHIGIVLQEPYLFSRSLADNIGIAIDETDENRYMQMVRESSMMACLHESAERFTHGYDTVVGERGVTLSGGQKQRAAIAQMLIKRSDIEIFDDSLSAVDAQTDARIRAKLADRGSKATTILISHRITTLMGCDMIYVLNRGKVAESGSHEELMAHDGIYSRIYSLQMQLTGDKGAV